jgi:ABC-type branched-subunit amino acid transport system substrate-binding protein
MRMTRALRIPVIATALALATIAAQIPLARTEAAEGVTPTEIVIGTHADLSGPLRNWGIAVRNGIEMALEEANAAGGIDGRQLRLIVKDDGYDPVNAAEAVRDLIETDRVFAILSPLGTPTSNAAAREAVSRDTLYLFPLVSAEQTPELQSPYMFALTQSLDEAVADGLRNVMQLRTGARVGVLATDDTFGRAVRRGAVRQLAATGLAPAADVTFARGAAEYGFAMRWLREQGAEIIVLGAVGEEVIAILQTARAMRWQPTFLCPSSCYTPELASLGGEVVEGLYAVGQVPIPYPNDPQLGPWARRYEARFGTVASKQALTAWRNTRLFLAALGEAGRIPTRESFRHALETLPPWTDPVIGGEPIRFTPSDHLGQHQGFLARVRGGRWTILVQRSPTRL